MKSIHPSLYRARSNSLTSVHRPLHTASVIPFFDSPPPPPVRPGIRLAPSRLPSEHPNGSSSTQQSTHSHGGHPPLPLALGTTSPSNQLQSQYALFNYSTSPPNAQSHPHPSHSSHEVPLRSSKRQRLKYQLDVGAYGIPKRCRSNDVHRGIHTRLTPPCSSPDDLPLAVQVGEDAYFVRDNAMGIADGVGGWTKSKNHDPQQATASALFARRLMHYCSAEVEQSSACRNPKSPIFNDPAPHISQPQFSFIPQFKPRTDTRTAPIFSAASSYVWEEIEAERLRQEQLEEDLNDTLDELSEGIDVLQILERAYDQTIKTHVAPARPPASQPTAPSAISRPPTGMGFSLLSKNPSPEPEPTPLMSGSSTALLAVLDHAPRQPTAGNSGPSALSIVSSSAFPPLSASAPSTSSVPERPSATNYAAGTLNPSIYIDSDAAQPYDAVLKIAHVGDCMGMLIRDEEIIWRSEEMWWDFNMPLQLGPATHPTVKPSTAAHHFTLPVRADDILILASDGLSDNLWDEEVLDEVVKFRHSFLGKETNPDSAPADLLLRRKTLAGMLSEALCSRARKVSERRATPKASGTSTPKGTQARSVPLEEDEIPFARRARESGRYFRGGKQDDISVIVAVISPAESEGDVSSKNLP
ncbi:hypothetical protein FA15DRAFT_666844 [Coprinopsis marcescibilis]|uniref:Protein phosphatase n=1 Tax=Coprinopsis marcescibilis TaxID=230819 RepID=A0A5C3L2Y2_COPMA|nr:hypothetical protein FA15DRAFT_666844 [Coprinopsis marcescibilis]